MLALTTSRLRSIVYNILDKLGNDDVVRVFNILLLNNLRCLVVNAIAAISSLIATMERDICSRRSSFDLHPLRFVPLDWPLVHCRFSHKFSDASLLLAISVAAALSPHLVQVETPGSLCLITGDLNTFSVHRRLKLLCHPASSRSLLGRGHDRIGFLFSRGVEKGLIKELRVID